MEALPRGACGVGIGVVLAHVLLAFVDAGAHLGNEALQSVDL
jgi:hypothetical protein